MKADGDCALELMCMWRSILAYRRFGRLIPGKVIEEAVSSQQILSMRHAITDTQDLQIHDKKNTMLHQLMKQSLVDLLHSPSKNGGRNAEVQVALTSLPPGVDETEWLDSKDVIDLDSLLIRTGKHQVFGEVPELEAFSLMLDFPLAIYFLFIYFFHILHNALTAITILTYNTDNAYYTNHIYNVQKPKCPYYNHQKTTHSHKKKEKKRNNTAYMAAVSPERG